MLTYLKVHLYFLFPPISILTAVLWPILGRRAGLKVLWLALMATVYTTPWDNWILSQDGWGYPNGSIVAKIFHVPLEEHMFFILQPILVILLHTLLSHSSLLPFDVPTSARVAVDEGVVADADRKADPTMADVDADADPSTRRKTLVNTLCRRPIAAAFWLALTMVGGLLVNEAHQIVPDLTPADLRIGMRAFYLGWILVWISPVIAWLTWLGAQGFGSKAERWTFLLGGGYLCMVDTIAIRSGAWHISTETSLGFQVVRGLPFEEFLFFLLTTHLIILTSSLISHLHTLLLLSPELPPSPPANFFKHMLLLARVAFRPPKVDANVLLGLEWAEHTLRVGSKSFETAKLAFGREMRIGLIAIYAWSRVTDNLIDDLPTTGGTDDDIREAKLQTLDAIRQFLYAAYRSSTPDAKDKSLAADPESYVKDIPHLSTEALSAFRLFAATVPRLVPIYPFLELCRGYEADMAFLSLPTSPSEIRKELYRKMQQPSFKLKDHFPIKTNVDLMQYADCVAGSIASAICYLSWSILDTPIDTRWAIRPAEDVKRWCRDVHPLVEPSARPIELEKRPKGTPDDSLVRRRMVIVNDARAMGRALQLVNIARDICKDAAMGRVYVPLSAFPSVSAMLDVLLPPPSGPGPSYAPYSLPIIKQAYELRRSSEKSIEALPSTARGGTRAMVASYFEIAAAVKKQCGEVDERGVKVSKWRRASSAAKAMWGLA